MMDGGYARALNQVKRNDITVTCFQKIEKYLSLEKGIEHGAKHAEIVSNNASQILEKLGYSLEEVCKAAIAGYLHDLGYISSRENRAHLDTALAVQIMLSESFTLDWVMDIAHSIGNHSDLVFEQTDIITAAVILADRCDLRKERAANTSKESLSKSLKHKYIRSTELNIIHGAREIIFSIDADTDRFNSVYPDKTIDTVFKSTIEACNKAAFSLNAKFKFKLVGTPRR